MIDESVARELAMAAFEPEIVVLGTARELDNGWHFPCIRKQVAHNVSVFVNKNSGKVLRVPPGFPLERDPTLYDRGYMFFNYDLVILSVEDQAETLRVLQQLHFTALDVYYRNERVYRVARPLTDDEILGRLSSLPCVFTGPLHHQIDTLESARDAGWFGFRALESREKI